MIEGREHFAGSGTHVRYIHFIEKKVVITGGSGYLGSAVVEGLLAAGAEVANADVKTGESIDERAIFLACDVRETASIQDMLKKAEKKMGRIDVLIN